MKQNFIYRKDITRKEHETWFYEKVQKGAVDQFIVENEESKPLGCVYLQNIDHQHRKAEEGIFLNPECPKGKGIGKASVNLILDYAFNELKLHKVTARVLEYNKASLGLHKSVGFSKEALFRDEVYLNGKFENVVFFGMLESEFGGCK